MARLFTRSNNESLSIDTAAVALGPFTMACWFQAGDIGNNHTLMWLGDKDVSGDFWALGAFGSIANDPLRFTAIDAGTASNATTSTGYTANTWHHACGRQIADNSRAVYIDGGSEGTNATIRTPDGANRTALGRRMDSTPDLALDGRIADAAIWDVALTTAEVADLALGLCPLFVRPQSLVGYWPLIGGGLTTELDYVGDLDLAESAAWTTRNAAHAPIFFATPPIIIGVPAAAVSGVVLFRRRAEDY